MPNGRRALASAFLLAAGAWAAMAAGQSPSQKSSETSGTHIFDPKIPDKNAAQSPDATRAEAETFYQQAVAIERRNNMDAVRIYRRSARSGNGKAAKRLGEIFRCGIPGVPRDVAESLQWFGIASRLGETVPKTGIRDAGAC
jgi:TPR repeat protein